MSDELKAIRKQAEAFAREHVVECAAELIEWSNTSLLRDGRVRELARMLEQLDKHHSLTLAERFATQAALERAAQPAQTERALTDLPEAVLSAIDERAAANIDDWAERQPVEPTKETCNAMYVRELVRLLSEQVR